MLSLQVESTAAPGISLTEGGLSSNSKMRSEEASPSCSCAFNSEKFFSGRYVMMAYVMKARNDPGVQT